MADYLDALKRMPARGDLENSRSRRQPNASAPGTATSLPCRAGSPLGTRPAARWTRASLIAWCCGAGRRCGISAPPMRAISARWVAMPSSTCWCFRVMAIRRVSCSCRHFVEGWRASQDWVGDVRARRGPWADTVAQRIDELELDRRAHRHGRSRRPARSRRLAAAQRLCAHARTLAEGGALSIWTTCWNCYAR